MRVRIHRGAHEIGGSCVELESEGARLVLDVGKPLSADPRDHVPLPAVPGLADGGDPALVGVLISHPHLDHSGLVDQVHPTVPVFAGREAATLVSAARFFSPLGPASEPQVTWSTVDLCSWARSRLRRTWSTTVASTPMRCRSTEEADG